MFLCLGLLELAQKAKVAKGLHVKEGVFGGCVADPS
jgi:hypothetical protein